MNKPTISVVMVTRNVESFLAEAIESILGQTFQDFEFIIVDFGSTDKSKEISSSYGAKDGRIRLHEIAPCALAEARNMACRLTQGKYIAVMDSDDVAVPDRLLWEFEFMEKHPTVGLLGGATEWVDSAGRSLYVDRFPTTDRDVREAFSEGCPYCQPTVLFRKDAFFLAGGYRAVFGQSEDYDLWMRIAEHFEATNLEQVVLKYRIHPGQISMRQRKEQTLSILAAQLSARERLKGNPDPLNTCIEITPAVLAGLGVSEAEQERKIVTGYRHWIRRMALAGEHAVALEVANEVARTNWQFAEQWQIADLYVIIAELYWQQKKFFRGIFAIGRAVAIRPKIVGRPLRPFLERLRLA
jgi:glycosyltransferase involved in cell wall biosynthesis